MTSVGSSRNWDLKLHGAGPGEPCPPLPPLFVRVLSMRSLGITLLISIGNVKKRQHLKVVIQIWQNLAEILFKYHLVKESIRLKVGKEIRDSLVSLCSRLGQSWTLPWAVTSPNSQTSRGQQGKRERLGWIWETIKYMKATDSLKKVKNWLLHLVKSLIASWV